MNIRIGFPVVAACAVAVGGALAAAIPAGATVSLQSQSPAVAAVRLAPAATLEAKGAGVTTTVEVVCRPGTYANLTVTVTEKAKGRIAAGQTYRNVTNCTGQPQPLTLVVDPTEIPFKKGVAFGRAELQFYEYNTNIVVRDEHDIRIG